MADVHLEPPFAAYEGGEPFIFASYAHKDGPAVFAELARLHGLGYRIWFDEGIDPGNEWPDEIARALDGCTQFLVFISPDAVVSRNVTNEIQLALRRQKPLLAVYLQDTQLPPGLDLNIGTMQHVMKYRMTPENYQRKMDKALPAATLASSPPSAKAQPLPPAPDSIARGKSSARLAIMTAVCMIILVAAWIALRHSPSPRTPTATTSAATPANSSPPFADFLGKWSLLRDGNELTYVSISTNRDNIITFNTNVISADEIEFGRASNGDLVVLNYIYRARFWSGPPFTLKGGSEINFPPGTWHQMDSFIDVHGKTGGNDTTQNVSFDAKYLPDHHCVLLTRHIKQTDLSRPDRNIQTAFFMDATKTRLVNVEVNWSPRFPIFADDLSRVAPTNLALVDPDHIAQLVALDQKSHRSGQTFQDSETFRIKVSP